MTEIPKDDRVGFNITNGRLILSIFFINPAFLIKKMLWLVHWRYTLLVTDRFF